MNYFDKFKKQTGIDPNKDPIALLREQIEADAASFSAPDFEPTGVQEDYIVPFGCGDYDIVCILDNNKAGKTATAVNILKNVIWPYDEKWFGWWQGKNLYLNWPYPKSGRIIGTVKNTADNGPIRKEILKWWPKGRYRSEKASKAYESQYWTDTGFDFDVMTYQQEPEEFEGPLLGWTWCDEPPPEKIVGAITSRFIQGGIWLITATPISCGPFLDIIEDLRSAGSRIYVSSHSLYESDVMNGKPNHLGTKRGLWTTEEIRRYEANTPIDERGARIYGKANAKSGKIYSDFNPSVHVIGGINCPYAGFSVDSETARKANCFCIIDPHRKGFPAIQWWMLLENNDLICYNEWPTVEFLGGYYDETRKSVICNYTPEQIANFIKIFDGTKYGLTMRARVMDPRFGKASEGEYGRATDSLMAEYARHGLIFELPPMERIEIQRDVIRDKLRYDPMLPINPYNKPKIYWMEHCKNSIRAIERHYWDAPERGKAIEREAERYKDFIDTIRYLLAWLGESGYEARRAKKERMISVKKESPYVIHETGLA